MELLLSVILGWLLGILSPGIINFISNNRRQKKLKQSIISDLKDLKIRLTWIPFRIKCSYGILDEKFIKWLKIQTNNWKDLGETPANITLEDIEKIEKQSTLDAYNSLYKKNKPAFSFPKMLTSIIDSNLMNVELLDDDFLSKILEIKFQINGFNKEVDRLNELYKMTFDSNIISENHSIISTQIEATNLTILDKAIYIVEKINRIINSNN